MAKHYKSIAFDLNTVLLKHCDINVSKAYRDLGRFMHKNGFIHRQGSVYNSVNKLDREDVNKLMKGLSKTLPWTSFGVSAIDVTDIAKKHHSLLHLLKTSEIADIKVDDSRDVSASVEAEHEVEVSDTKDPELQKAKTPMQLAIEKRNRELEEKGLPPVAPVKKTKNKNDPKG